MHQLSVLLRNKGRYWASIKEHEKAITALEESVAISEDGGKFNDASETYKILGDACIEAGRLEEGGRYLRKYAYLNDSIQQSKRLFVDIPLSKIVAEKEQKYRKHRYVLYGIVILLTLLGIFIGYLSRRAVNKKKREKEEVEAHFQEKVEESKSSLQEKEQEISSLQLKINESFETLVQLAKENDASFYTRFEEVYPEFINKLRAITPDLQITELTLCAYIYLNFPTKDIATYTFKSVKTIQNRKNSLRKRLFIDSAEDIYIKFKNL